MTLKSFITIERILWLAVLIFALLFFKRCSDKKSAQLAAIKAQSVALQQKHLQDSINFTEQVARWQDSIRTADINSDLQVKVIKETEKKLQASQTDISRLTAIIKSKPRPADSSFVLVPPEYKDACDSMPGKFDAQNIIIADLKKDNEGLVDLMNYEVVYRDSLIETGKEYIDSLRRDYNKQKAQFDAAVNLAKPRGRLLGGIGIMGNQQYLLSGANAKLGYQDKRGKTYLASGHIMKFPPLPNPVIMGELSVLFKF